MRILPSNPSLPIPVPSPARDVTRRGRLTHLVRQHPLFETRPSMRALQRSCAAPGGAVFTGIGVASGRAVSRALPLDALGMLLAAEQVRRTADARELVVVVADAHAIAHGADVRSTLERADATARLLEHIAQVCRLGPTRVVRGSELDDNPDYRATLEHVRGRAPAGTDPYVLREVSDMAHFDAHCGGIIKLGWVLQASPSGAERDERMFDRRFQQWVGREVGLLYCKAGRALDDRRLKRAPYLESDPSRRVCLRPGEDVHAKLTRARASVSPSTLAAVRKHLRAIARTYGKLVRPLRGSLEERTQTILHDLLDAGALGAAAQGLRREA